MTLRDQAADKTVPSNVEAERAVLGALLIDSDAVGGSSYLAELVNDVPTAVHVEYYAHIVERCAIMRRLIDAAGKIAGIGYDNPPDVDQALDQAEQHLFQVSQRRVSQDFTSLREALRQYFDTIEYLHEHRGEVVGVPSGFHDLDQLTG